MNSASTTIILIPQASTHIDTSYTNQLDFEIESADVLDNGKALKITTNTPTQDIQIHFEQGDFFILNNNQPRPRMLFADMDSTIVESETLDDLAAFFGLQQEVAAITQQAMHGEINFEEALTQRVKMLKDLPENQIEKLLPTIKISPGAEELLKTCQEKGIKTCLVSGGFTHITSYIAETLGFDAHYGNQFIIKNGKLTGEVTYPIQNKDSKLNTINKLCKEYQIPIEAVLAVGDGANDIPMLQAAGYGVAYKAKPIVTKTIPLSIQKTNLFSLKYLLDF